ncbi:hypothetical protein HK097_006508, partial [Rhizophlyctis rosea]
MWDHATALAQDLHTPTDSILAAKAAMHQSRNDLLAAAQTYIQLGDYIQAIDILGENGWIDQLMDVARKLEKSEANMKLLSKVVWYLRKNTGGTGGGGEKAQNYAAEVLVKMGDVKHLVEFHVETKNWDEAFRIVDRHPDLVSIVCVPYADYLAQQDRYLEAQENYRRAGRYDLAFKVLSRLTQNAVTEKRYDDAGWYYFTTGLEGLGSLPEDVTASGLSEEQHKVIEEAMWNIHLGEVYSAYSVVEKYVELPFTSFGAETLFCMCLFLWGEVQSPSVRKPFKWGTSASTRTTYGMVMRESKVPKGISMVKILYALSKTAKKVGAWKTARFAYEKLRGYVVPEKWRAE